MALSYVGLGWAAGVRNYDTLAAWHSAKKASGVFEEAVCSGNIGSSSVLIVTSDYSAGALIRGDVQYDGTNHNSLARLNARLAGQATSGLVVVQDLYIQTTGLNASISFTANNVIQRCYVTSTGDTGSNSSIIATATGGIAKNCVVHQPSITNIRGIRATSGGKIENCISIGSNYPIFSEWTDSSTKNSFAVATASTTACQYYPNGVPALNANNASTDGTPATGTSTIRNVNKYDVFANFDANDFRIKQSSVLGQAGIGAFFYNDAPTQIATRATSSTGRMSSSSNRSKSLSLTAQSTGRIQVTTTRVKIGSTSKLTTARAASVTQFKKQLSYSSLDTALARSSTMVNKVATAQRVSKACASSNVLCFKSTTGTSMARGQLISLSTSHKLSSRNQTSVIQSLTSYSASKLALVTAVSSAHLTGASISFKTTTSQTTTPIIGASSFLANKIVDASTTTIARGKSFFIYFNPDLALPEKIISLDTQVWTSQVVNTHVVTTFNLNSDRTLALVAETSRGLTHDYRRSGS